ncbi:MAG: S8 family peptidase [Planctomycetota bacterium]
MNTRTIWTMALLAGSAASVALGGAPVNNAQQAEPVLVPFGGSAMALLAGDLDGATASAISPDAFAPDKHGLRAADFPQITLTSRVLVQTDDLARLRADAAPAQPKLQPGAAAGAQALAAAPAVRAHASVRGFAIVETGSVREALELAQRLEATGAYGDIELDVVTPITKRAIPNDPLLSSQWHLRNTSVPLADIDADAAWSLGYTGLGMTIGIVEDGFQQSHPDIAPNYDAVASQGSPSSADRHATACAGIAAGAGNNGLGITGLAYNASISQQFLGSSSQTASAFAFRNDLNDVKSNSWGPADNGWIWTFSSVERNALQQAAELGRAGLGTSIAWAAGNGGTGDRVDYDPYASSRFTLAVGSAGDQDRRASYNELGSSMLVVTHSSGNNRGTTTTDLVGGAGYTSGDYTTTFGGTSSASPLGAGAVALALEANPALTWRDVQHVLIESARKIDPGSSNWTVNGAGYDISYDYGFGAIDAGPLVQTAASWVNVAPETSITSGVVTANTPVPDNNSTGISESVTISEDITIESVELIVNINTTYRGDLDIFLVAPSGTESQVSRGNRNDPNDNLNDYVFTSLRHWGESSAGEWTIRVADRANQDTATLVDFEIRAYGTASASPCSPADLAAPFGSLDFFDVSAYLGLFDSSDPAADLAAPSGSLDFFDVIEYLSTFDAGC